MSNLILRDRSEADGPALLDLWVASWREAMPQIDFDARREWFRARLAGLESQGARVICAFDPAARMLGFAVIDLRAHYLDQIAVAPEAKGGGAAKALLDEARRLSPQEVMLEVNQDNPRALRFYEREGFERIAEGVNPRSGLRTWRLRWPRRDIAPPI